MDTLLKIKNFLLNVLFPTACLSCGKTSENDICPECRSKIRVNTSLFCPDCRLRLADNKKVCHKNSQFLLAAATGYDNESVRNLLKSFKFKKWRRLQKPIGEILTSYLKTLNLELKNWVVVPVPLSQNREKERGFNQAKLIAQIAADFYKLDLIEPIQRIKNTKTQSLAKSYEERQQNVAGCFSIANPELVEGRNILLVDDVLTSGATIAEAVKVLKSCGAKKIIALVIAKTR